MIRTMICERGNSICDQNAATGDSADGLSLVWLSIAQIRQRLEAVLGRRPSYATVGRWTRKGCHGVVLESRRIGHEIRASARAVDRFIADLTAARAVERDQPRMRSRPDRRQAHAAALKRCQELGIVPGAKKMPSVSVTDGQAAPHGSTAGASHVQI